MRLWTAAACSAILMTSGSLAVCASDLGTAFKQFGYSDMRDVSRSKCVIKSDLDRRVFIKRIPDLQSLGLLNKEITQTRINSEPVSMAVAFSLQIAPVLTKSVYEDAPDADKCVFIHSFLFVDDYGNSTTAPAFSYAFTRALYNKINWSGMQLSSFPKIAPEFKFGKETSRALSQE